MLRCRISTMSHLLKADTCKNWILAIDIVKNIVDNVIIDFSNVFFLESFALSVIVDPELCTIIDLCCLLEECLNDVEIHFDYCSRLVSCECVFAVMLLATFVCMSMFLFILVTIKSYFSFF